MGHCARSRTKEYGTSTRSMDWKKYHVLGMLGRSFLRLCDFYAQYRMRSAKLKNHLNHKIVTTKVWDEKI